MTGADQAEQLRRAGFSDAEVSQWAQGERSRLASAGFSDAEVSQWFGQPQPDVEPVRRFVRKNLDEHTLADGVTNAGAPGDAVQRMRAATHALDNGGKPDDHVQDGDFAYIGPAMADPAFRQALYRRFGIPADQVAQYEARYQEAAPAAGADAARKTRALQELGAGPTAPVDARPTRSFDDALSAGLQMSVMGLIARGRMPDRVLSQDPSMSERIASSIGQAVGDFPATVAGAVLGGAGGIETGPGAAITAGAGAFGLPAGLRATLIDAYEKGGFATWRDFWERSSGIIWQEVKGMITGAATVGAGQAAKAVLPAGAPAAARVLAPTTAEVATMTAVGKALEGEVPNAQDFADAAVLLGGMKAAGATADVAGRLRRAYVAAGTRPQDVVAQAAKDPTVLASIIDDKPAMGAPGGLEQPTPQAGAAERGASAGLEPSDAQRAVLDRISVGEPEKRSFSWDKFYTAVKDDLYPVRKITDELAAGRDLSTAEDPYRLARLTRGLAGKAEQFLDVSPFKFDTYENVGKPLRRSWSR
jgi:hypothetical protein